MIVTAMMHSTNEMYDYIFHAKLTRTFVGVHKIFVKFVSKCTDHGDEKVSLIIKVIFKCYFSGDHIALSIKKNNNGVNIELGKTNRLKAKCMMQINA